MNSKESNENLLNTLQESELAADFIESKLCLTAENKVKTKSVITEFLQSYQNKSADESNTNWLQNQFNKYPEIWDTAEESSLVANEIVESIGEFEHKSKELQDHLDKGMSRDNWLAQQVELAAKVHGINDVGAYASEIENAIDTANANNQNLIYRNDGQLNQQMNLDGFIAEHQHVNDFNIDAAAKGSEYRAKVLEPQHGETYGKNSVDMVITDGNGKVVRRYQAKYGSDAKATEVLLKKGDYRGQRKLVPKGQAKDIEGSTEVIEIGGVSSKAVSKEDVKQQQQRAQEKAEIKKYDWNDANRTTIAKSIGKQAVLSACISVGYQGGRILGRRIWNSLTGKQNKSVNEDLQEFVGSAVKSAGSTGIAVAVTGGVTVAVKSGWLGNALKATSVGRIANAVCVGIENIKVLSKYAKGEITGTEALDQAANTTVSTIASIAAGTKGASIGAAIGSALGPVGTVVGGLAGGLVGGLAGSAVASTIYEGGKKIAKAAYEGVKSIGSSIASGISSFCSGVSNFIFG